MTIYEYEFFKFLRDIAQEKPDIVCSHAFVHLATHVPIGVLISGIDYVTTHPGVIAGEKHGN